MYKLKAKIIAEGANGPITFEADQYLSKNNKVKELIQLLVRHFNMVN